MNQRKSIKDLFKDLKYKTSYKENNIFCVCKEIILNSTKFFFYIKDDNLILLNSNKKIISDFNLLINKNYKIINDKIKLLNISNIEAGIIYSCVLDKERIVLDYIIKDNKIIEKPFILSIVSQKLNIDVVKIYYYNFLNLLKIDLKNVNYFNDKFNIFNL